MPDARYSLADRIRFLGSIPLFAGIREDVLKELAQSAPLRKLDKGELLFYQTDPSDAVYIVRSGCISLFLATPDGREMVINEMRAGDCFGELGLVTGLPRSTGAMAREHSLILRIPKDTFMESLDAEPKLMRRVLRMTAKRLRVSSERESALAFLDSDARIARVLLLLHRQTEGKGVVRITQEELAQFAGLIRQTVAKTLSKWRSEGWIETGRGKILLRNIRALEELTEEFEI
jgi:CRP/FNR family cyclic AMP-dependent transcriptional regulator